jgi:hypothetical protein
VVTGYRCRCCIKEVKQNDSKEPIVKTKCRDNNTAKINKYDKSSSHKLSENTDFVSIFTEKNRYFVCGDLKNERTISDYRNSTKDYLSYYQSTIVVPIRADVSQHDSEEFCWGFLCIDSIDKNVFNDPCFIDLAGSFADMLYSFFIVFQSLNTPSQTPTPSTTSGKSGQRKNNIPPLSSFLSSTIPQQKGK